MHSPWELFPASLASTDHATDAGNTTAATTATTADQATTANTTTPATTANTTIAATPAPPHPCTRLPEAARALAAISQLTALAEDPAHPFAGETCMTRRALVVVIL